MRILPVLALCACLLFHAGQAKALTDEDHTRYAREFPAYAQAEQRLNAAWKHLKQQLSKDEFQALLTEQRNWVNTTRDAEAKAQAGPGPFANAAPLANAYAAVTMKRAEALEARIKKTAPQNAPAAQAAPVKNATTTQPAASPKSPPTAGQGAPAAKSPQANQAAPVVKGSPKSPQPAAGKDAPSLQMPDVPLTGGAPEHPGSIVGSYGSGSNLVEVKASGKGYYVAVSTASPDARWVCEMEGLGVLEGDTLRVTSVSSGQSVIVPIQFKDDSLIIPATQAATCGFGGSIEVVYKKK